MQLLWRYHYLLGTGSRAELRLDDVAVYSAGSYQDWVTNSFVEGEAGNPAISGPQVEYLNDGYPNLVKYALGIPASDPVTPNQLEMGVKPDGRLFARFHMDRSLSDITYRLETSSNLLNWDDTVFDSQNFWQPNSDGEMHEVIIPASVETSEFIRLGIIKN